MCFAVLLQRTATGKNDFAYGELRCKNALVRIEHFGLISLSFLSIFYVIQRKRYLKQQCNKTNNYSRFEIQNSRIFKENTTLLDPIYTGTDPHWNGPFRICDDFHSRLHWIRSKSIYVYIGNSIPINSLVSQEWSKWLFLTLWRLNDRSRC